MRLIPFFVFVLGFISLQAQFSHTGVIQSGFNTPSQIAKDEDQNIYVVDSNNHRIKVFNSDGNFIRQFGSPGSGNGELSFPQDLAIDSNGDCYVLDDHQVSVFDFQGDFVKRFNVNGFGGIAVDQNYVYIAGPLNQGLQRLDKNGVFDELIIEGGSEPGKVDGIKDFVIDGIGNLYVMEQGGKRVQVFDNNGLLIQTIGVAGNGDGEFSSPQGIALDDVGRIYVTDDVVSAESRVQIFDPSGNLTAIIGLGVNNSNGIAVNIDGRVYVTDVAGNQALFFDGDLDILEEPEIEVLLPVITYGDPSFQLTPTSPSTGAYQYEILSGTDATIAQDGTVTVLGAGQVSVRVTQSPTALYTQGVKVVVMDISKATLLVKANDETRTYGNSNPVFTANYTGFKNGDTFSVIDTPPQITSGATIASAVGGYPIVPNNGSDDNYSFNYVSGTLTIEKAPLIITADNKSRKYGEVNPSFTFQYTGFLNNDTFLDLNSQPVGHTDADDNSHVGSYVIDLTGAADNNYEIEYVTGQLTIGKAALIVTISDASKIYGDENPEFTAEYDGFVNNDDLSDIDIPPVLNSTGVAVGEYPINAINGLDNDYEIVSVSATLEITKAPLTATAEDQTREYNQPNPAFTIEFEGFKNNDDASDLIAEPLGSTSATQTSSVGTYAIILTGGSATNYELTLVNGQLTITKASQLISFGPLPSPVFNTLAPFALNATADSGLGVTYRVSSGPASVAANIVTLSGELGSVTIEATQPGNGNYNAAVPVSQSFEVVEQPVTGIEDELSTLNVYPNPSKGEFWLSSPEGIQAYEVLNANGVLIAEQHDLLENDILVNLPSVPNGIYILIVQMQHGKKLTRKISIVR